MVWKLRNMDINVLHVATVILMVCTGMSSAGVVSTTILGLDSGEILRCKYEDLTDCSTLGIQQSSVNALVASGEFVYIGLQSGELRRCSNTKPSNCTVFHEFDSEINALAISGKNVFAAFKDSITKCGLRKSEDCSTFQKSDSPVYSLVVREDNIFAGREESILNCPLSGLENCTVSFNTTSPVTTLSFFGKNIYAGLKEGSVQRCEQDNGTITNCSIFYKSESSIKALDIFNEHVQISLKSGDIIRTTLENDGEVSTTSRNASTVLSMSSIYATTKVNKHYVGESAGCTWQFFSCPPYVVYYDIESRTALELRVKNGKLYSTNDELFTSKSDFWSHTGKHAIFVMDPSGKIYASSTHPILLLHHSSLMAGNPVSAAGEIGVENGVINFVSTCSGHYRPSLALTEQLNSALKRQGYEGNVTVQDCGSLRLMIDLDYKKTDLYYKAQYEEYSAKMKELDNK